MDDIELDDDELLDGGEPTGDGDTLYEHFRIEVDKGQVSVRIDKFLAEHQPHSSRNSNTFFTSFDFSSFVILFC